MNFRNIIRPRVRLNSNPEKEVPVLLAPIERPADDVGNPLYDETVFLNDHDPLAERAERD